MKLDTNLNKNVWKFYSKQCVSISLKWKYGLLTVEEAKAARRTVLDRLGWKRIKRNPYFHVDVRATQWKLGATTLYYY